MYCGYLLFGMVSSLKVRILTVYKRLQVTTSVYK